MKQRLCIAKTLIHDPPVLLLDEPASGVDPRARIEIKALLKELKTMGKTVLISSHILPDIQDLCDEILVIEKGKKIFHGKIDDLLRTTSGGCIVLEVEVPEDKINKAIDLIKTFDGVASLKKDSSTILIKFFGDKFKYSKILKILCENNIPVFKFGERETGLEDAFIKITKGELA
jgi:ABC-2 type transport system ATP-binding protein